MDWFLDVGGILPNLNITFRKPENFTNSVLLHQWHSVFTIPILGQKLPQNPAALEQLQLTVEKPFHSCTQTVLSSRCHFRKTSGLFTYLFQSVLWALDKIKCDQFYQWTLFTLPRLEKIVLGKLYPSVKLQLTKELGKEDGGRSQNLCTSSRKRNKTILANTLTASLYSFFFFFNLTTM